MLVTASTEVDKSGASYYGEQTLHYLHVGGETAHVQLRESPMMDTIRTANVTKLFKFRHLRSNHSKIFKRDEMTGLVVLLFRQPRTAPSTTWPGVQTRASSAWFTASCRQRPPSLTSSVTPSSTLGPALATPPTTGEDKPPHLSPASRGDPLLTAGGSSPQGHILVLAGFGNLQGQMEFWDAKKYQQVRSTTHTARNWELSCI